MRQFKPGQLQTGSIYPITSSQAITASFALNSGVVFETGSLLTTASFNAFTASYTTGSFTGSFQGDGSQLTGIVSSKWTGSNPISRQSDVEITGSLRVQGIITGSLFGTASWANNAITASNVQTAQTASYILNAISSSFASTASFVENAQTASYVLNAVSSSYATNALSASYSLNSLSASYALISSTAQSGNGAFSGSFTGSYIGDGAGLYNIPASGIVGLNLSQIVSGSVSASISPTNGLQINTNVTATSFTGSLSGSASTAISASYALTASFAQTAQTASYVLQAVSASFATSASFAVSASRAVTASLALTASFVTPLNQNVLITGSLNVTQNITGSRMFLSASSNMNSGSTLYIYGSGSTQPVFTVQGSSGELFSVTDSLSGSLFSVNDISGLPILEVFSDNTTLIGNYLDPMLITTAKVTQTNSGSFVVYSLPTASYDTAFFEYSVKSGSNARAGTIMAIQSGSSVNFTETTTLDFGSTTAISLVVVVTGSNMALTGSSTAGAWTIKSIVRGI